MAPVTPPTLWTARSTTEQHVHAGEPERESTRFGSPVGLVTPTANARALLAIVRDSAPGVTDTGKHAGGSTSRGRSTPDPSFA